jgi:glutamate-1-semialdehyde aminotransferase
MFSSNITSVDDAEHSEHSSMSKADEYVEQVSDRICAQTRRITIHQIANMLGISFGSAQKTDTQSAHMSNYHQIQVHHLLNEEQEEN